MIKISKKHQYFGGIIGPFVFLLVLSLAGSRNFFLLSSIFLSFGMTLVIFTIGLIRHYEYKNSNLIFIGGIVISSLGILLAFYGTIFLIIPFNEGATFSVEMHNILTGVYIFVIILVIPIFGICLYIETRWKLLRQYSIVTVLIMGTFGGLTSLLIINNMELLGLFERIMIYAYNSWIFILAFLLMRGLFISKLVKK